MEGFIIKNISNDYVVKSDKGIYTCKARGNFRHRKMTPLVGDYVTFSEDDLYILDIKSRKNSLYARFLSVFTQINRFKKISPKRPFSN
jgi:ribosome biogenesis GTPase